MLSWKRKIYFSLADAFEFYDVAIYSALAVYMSLNFSLNITLEIIHF